MPQTDLLPTESDEALASRSLRGDREAEAELIRRLYPRVHALASRMLRNPETARDAVQETFLKAFSRLHLFDASQRFSAWLFKILVNGIRDECRRGRLASIDGGPDGGAGTSLTPGDVIIREEEIGHIREEIASLPAGLRLAVLLHYQEGLNGREVAYALGISHQAARLKICRGIARVRAQLAEDR